MCDNIYIAVTLALTRAEAGVLCGQVPKLAALAAGLETTAQQLAYCQHNASATNCSRLPPLLPVSKQLAYIMYITLMHLVGWGNCLGAGG